MASLLSQGINGPKYEVEAGLSSKRQSVTSLPLSGDGHIPPRPALLAAPHAPLQQYLVSGRVSSLRTGI